MATQDSPINLNCVYHGNHEARIRSAEKDVEDAVTLIRELTVKVDEGFLRISEKTDQVDKFAHERHDSLLWKLGILVGIVSVIGGAIGSTLF